MASPDRQSLPDAPDWQLLSALFARGGEHRHKMGLRRGDVQEFYSATPAGPAIRREKQVILNREAERRTVVSRDGHRAAVEFARFAGLSPCHELPDELPGWQTWNQLLGLALEPDLLLVQPPDWTLVWANMCFPSRWSLEGKAGQPLSGIHHAVPALNADLGSKIAAFFSHLAPGDGWRRANWGLSASCERDQHPSQPIPALGPVTTPENLFLRIEDQHLLKLPETGAIAFGIRIASFAWSDLRQNPAVFSALLEQIYTMPEEIARYKGIRDLPPCIETDR